MDPFTIALLTATAESVAMVLIKKFNGQNLSSTLRRRGDHAVDWTNTLQNMASISAEQKNLTENEAIDKWVSSLEYDVKFNSVTDLNLYLENKINDLASIAYKQPNANTYLINSVINDFKNDLKAKKPDPERLLKRLETMKTDPKLSENQHILAEILTAQYLDTKNLLDAKHRELFAMCMTAALATGMLVMLIVPPASLAAVSGIVLGAAVSTFFHTYRHYRAERKVAELELKSAQIARDGIVAMLRKPHEASTIKRASLEEIQKVGVGKNSVEISELHPLAEKVINTNPFNRMPKNTNPLKP